MRAAIVIAAVVIASAIDPDISDDAKTVLSIITLVFLFADAVEFFLKLQKH